MKTAMELNQSWNEGWFYKDLVLTKDSFILRHLQSGTHDRNIRQMVASQLSCRECEVDQMELVETNNDYSSDVLGILQVRLKYGAIYLARALLDGKYVKRDTDGGIYITSEDDLKQIKLETIADYWNEHNEREADSLAG